MMLFSLSLSGSAVAVAGSHLVGAEICRFSTVDVSAAVYFSFFGDGCCMLDSSVVASFSNVLGGVLDFRNRLEARAISNEGEDGDVEVVTSTV